MGDKSYSEMIRYDTVEDRYTYLRIGGQVGLTTFGTQRGLNQAFYTSSEWLRARAQAIVRDNSCDMAIPGLYIPKGAVVHHINPITPHDVKFSTSKLFDPENLVVVSHDTHNAIHYGQLEDLGHYEMIERRPGDTKFW